MTYQNAAQFREHLTANGHGNGRFIRRELQNIYPLLIASHPDDKYFQNFRFPVNRSYNPAERLGFAELFKEFGRPEQALQIALRIEPYILREIFLGSSTTKIFEYHPVSGHLKDKAFDSLPRTIGQMNELSQQTVSPPNKSLMAALARIANYDAGALPILMARTDNLRTLEDRSKQIGIPEAYQEDRERRARAWEQQGNFSPAHSPRDLHLENTWYVASRIIEGHVRAAFMPEAEREKYMAALGNRLQFEYCDKERIFGNLAHRYSHLEQQDISHGGVSGILKSFTRKILGARNTDELRLAVTSLIEGLRGNKQTNHSPEFLLES